MADLYQNEHGGDRPLVLMSPRTRAHLVVKQGKITANYPGGIRVAYTGPQLLRHIQQRNQWSDTTTESINWTSHGTALRNHFRLRQHFSKQVHDILPTSAHLNKIDKGKRTCLTCAHTMENRVLPSHSEQIATRSPYSTPRELYHPIHLQPTARVVGRLHARVDVRRFSDRPRIHSQRIPLPHRLATIDSTTKQH
jgi:hypothetical protein